MIRTIRHESSAELRVRGRFPAIRRRDSASPRSTSRFATNDGFLHSDFVRAPVRKAHFTFLVGIGRISIIIVFLVFWHRNNPRLATYYLRSCLHDTGGVNVTSVRWKQQILT
jgi:multisubunit Na+/H+ antiporter MnhB subunit